MERIGGEEVKKAEGRGQESEDRLRNGGTETKRGGEKVKRRKKIMNTEF